MKQRSFDFRKRTRAGKLAKKPGRPKTGRRCDPRHRTRPEVSPRHPIHVVLRVNPDVGGLRRRRAYHAIRGAVARQARRADYRIVHLSIQSNHIHLLCEADSKPALTLGMQGFTISAAKRLNRVCGRKKGEVFPFRYHATYVTSPTQARNALAYILNNWRHHRFDTGARCKADPYSTGPAFYGEPKPDFPPLPTVRATSWLMTDGLSRASPISPYERPGPDPVP